MLLFFCLLDSIREDTLLHEKTQQIFKCKKETLAFSISDIYTKSIRILTLNSLKVENNGLNHLKTSKAAQSA